MKFCKSILLAAVIVWTNCHATVQERESLLYKGKEGSIEEEPAKPYFKKGLVFFDMVTIDLGPNAKPILFDRTAAGTNLGRGYLGSWEIEDDKLYLVKFRAWAKEGDSAKEVGLKYLFPKSKGKVFAEWFSGTLHFQTGKEKLSAWNGHITVCERLVVFEVTKGKVTKTQEYLYPKNVEVMNKMLSTKWGRKIDVRKEKHQ